MNSLLSSNPLFSRSVKPKEKVEAILDFKERIQLDAVERLTSLTISELHAVAEKIWSYNPLAPIGDTEIHSWWPSSSPPPSSALSFNTKLNVESLLPETILGEGAFGRVWLASENGGAQKVAVKQLSLEDLTVAKQAFRAGRELRAFSTLHHIEHLRRQQKEEEEEETCLPISEIETKRKEKKSSLSSSFCVQLKGSCATSSLENTTSSLSSSSSPFLYLFLEAASDGITLADIVKSISYDTSPSSPSQLDNIRFYLATVLAALKELHELGYAYRDVKLENVVIAAESDRYPRLVDLGFVRSVRPLGSDCPTCGKESILKSVLQKHQQHVMRNDNDDDDSKNQRIIASSVANTLSTLSCCECLCVNRANTSSKVCGVKSIDEEGSQNHKNDGIQFQRRCTRMHRYHNVSESLIHLSKLHVQWIKDKEVVDNDPVTKKLKNSTSDGVILVSTSADSSPITPKEKKEEDEGKRVGTSGGGGGDGTRSERSSSFVGTVAYLPPELIMVNTGTSSSLTKGQGEERGGHDCAVDVWSFGVLAHELLTGVSPFSQRLVSSTHPSDDDNEEEIDEEEDNDIEVLKRALKASSLDLSSILKIHRGKEGERGDVLEQDADDAVDLVRTLLQPDPTHRPCVHRVMQHPFFVRCRHFDWNDVLTRSYVPPQIPSSIIDDKRRRRQRRDKKNEDKPTKEKREEKEGGHSPSLTTSSPPPPPPLRFGKDTFLGMSESLFEARRAGGILSSSSSSSSSSLSSQRDDPLELLHEFNI